MEPKIVLNMAAVAKNPTIDTALAVEIYDIDASDLNACADFLLCYYRQDTIAVITLKSGTTRQCTVKELPDIIDPVLRLRIEGNSGINKRYCMGDLLRIIKRLTGESGCPWDKQQTHLSIRINMIEEAYEAVDAINRGDLNDMCEELGDVMLQAVLHSDIACRNKTFTFNDVVDGLCTKLVSRHTHIFGDNKASDANDALGFWEQAKGKEKPYSTLTDKLNSYPDTFSSALLAQKTFGKVAKEFKVEPSLLDRLFMQYKDGLDVGAALIFLLIGLEGLKHNDVEVSLRKLCKDIAGRVNNAHDFEELLNETN